VNQNREPISAALSARFRELCDKRIACLVPADFGEMAGFTCQQQERFVGVDPGALSIAVSPVSRWMGASGDCLPSLRCLALGEQMQLCLGQSSPRESFLESLRNARREPEGCFKHLAERYSCPLNFTLPEEDEIREYVLLRLMVPDRAEIEKSSLAAVKSDEILLKLNLIAVYASRVNDLRFLDALNYYYELLPVNWRPYAKHDWLLVSYFTLYARALAAWMKKYECV
jgi:hypothetical protein